MKRNLLVCFALALVTLGVFWPVHRQQFINFDDDIYVTDNPHVAQGLTWESVRWAFSTTRGTHWWPLTWLSHMLDCELFGLNAGAHKLVNVVFHIASALLLFLLLRRMTGAVWPSAFVAAVFALHPLRVESVAWVAERKDVLSTLFWMLSLWAYARYAERPGLGRYLWIVAFFVLGLMAKPMIVTLPFVLLLLDFWPLRRRLAWREKLPLFAISAVWSVVTYVVARGAEAVADTGSLGLFNAVVSYVRYLGKILWPVDLAVLYPLPPTWPASQVLAALLMIVAISIAAMRVAKTQPWWLVGWLWFLGTLVPVIGLVQVGHQAMADRFTYIPSIGISLAVAFGVARIRNERLTAFVGALVVAGCMVATSRQLRHWNDSVSLYRHTLAVTTENFVIEANLGVALCNQSRWEEGIAHLERALQLSPRFAHAHNHLGRALFVTGKIDEALVHLRVAVELAPRDAAAHNNLGIALAKQNRLRDAVTEFERAVQLRPDYSLARSNLVATLQLLEASR